MSGLQPERQHMMAFPRILAAPKLGIGLAYLAAYALLDWLSFIEPYAHLSITPWNPGIGLSYVLLFMFGRRMIPFAVVAPLVADIVQWQTSLPWIEIVAAILIGASYVIAALFLLRLRFDPTLSSMRDLLLLMAVTAVSAACVALGYVGLMVFAGLLPPADFAAA